MNGANARTTRVNFQLYMNPMTMPPPIDARLCKTRAKRVPVACSINMTDLFIYLIYLFICKFTNRRTIKYYCTSEAVQMTLAAFQEHFSFNFLPKTVIRKFWRSQCAWQRRIWLHLEVSIALWSTSSSDIFINTVVQQDEKSSNGSKLSQQNRWWRIDLEAITVHKMSTVSNASL